MSKFRKTLSLAAATCIFATSATPAFAQVTGYVTEKNGIEYEYDSAELIAAIMNGGSLYTRYLEENLVALRDDKKGLIDAEDVINAITNSEGSFDVDNYTESGDAKPSTVVVDKKVSVDESGEVKEDDVVIIEDKEAPVLSYAGETTITVANGASFTAPSVTGTDNVDATVSVTKVIKNAAGTVLEAIDTKVAGTYTITYSAKDAAGNASNEIVITVTVEEAVQELKVESVSAINLNTVEVTFNKAVTSTAKTEANYILNGTPLTSTEINAVKLSADNKKATLSFKSGKELTNKTYYNFEVKNVKDAEANEATYAELLYVNDVVAPTVKSAVYTHAANEFVIEFSETLLAGANGKVKVYDENNADVTASIVSPSTLTDKIVIDTSGLTASKTYKVVMQGATDLAGNYFANNRVEATFTTKKADEVKPVVSNLAIKDTKTIRVTFSEPIFVGAGSKIAEVSVDGNDLDGSVGKTDVKVGALGTKGNAAMVDNNPAVWDITLSTTALTGVKKITLNNFSDLSGNAQATAYDKFVTFVADTTAPNLVSSKVEGSEMILTFDEDITFAAAANTVKVLGNSIENTYTSAATAGASNVGIAVGTNKKIVTVDLANAVKESGSYKITIAKGVLADDASNSQIYEVTKDFTLVDTGKPALVGNAVTAITQLTNPSEVTIVFDKDLDLATALDATNYKVNGQVAFSNAIFSGDQKTVKLTVKPGAFDVDGDYLFAISNVKSKAGVVMKDFSGLKTGIKENVAPEVKADGAKLTTLGSITLTFNEKVKVSANAFEVYVDGVKVPSTIGAITTANVNAVIAITTDLTDVSKPITVKVASGAVITDANGNAFAPGSVLTVTQ